jgi:hypothetical protein
MQDQQVTIRLDAVDNTKKAFNDVKNSLKDTNNTLFTFQNALLAVGAILGSVFVNKLVSTTRAFEDIKSSLSFVTGSANEGAKAFNFLSDFAGKSKFSIKELSDTFVTLYTAGINPTEQLLKTFTNTAIGTTDAIGTLEQLTRLFAKGTQGGLGLVSLNQLAAKGIPVFKILQEQIGLDRAELASFAETATGSERILDALLKGLQKTFSGAEEQRINNLSSAFSDLSNQIDKVFNMIGEGAFKTALLELTKTTTELLKTIEPLTSAFGSLLAVLVNIDDGAFMFLNDAIKNSIKLYNEIVTKFGGKPIELKISVKEEVKAAEKLAENLDLVYQLTSKINLALIKLDDSWKFINKTIAVGVVGAISDVSKGIAESIILGKKLGDALKEIAQKILINIISKLIEEQLLRLALLAIEKARQIYEESRINNLARQNSLLAQQIGYQTTLASVSAYAGSGNGGGGASGFMNTIGTIANVASLFGFAEGGSVKAGQPITVGERGREIFIPKTSGTIVPNEKLGGGTVLNFNINATDVKGVQELLINNRATITNIVNQALNARGKSNLV